MTDNTQTNKLADPKLDELLGKVAEATIEADLPPQWCLDNESKLARFAAALLAEDAQRPLMKPLTRGQRDKILRQWNGADGDTFITAIEAAYGITGEKT